MESDIDQEIRLPWRTARSLCNPSTLFERHTTRETGHKEETQQELISTFLETSNAMPTLKHGWSNELLMINSGFLSATKALPEHPHISRVLTKMSTENKMKEGRVREAETRVELTKSA